MRGSTHSQNFIRHLLKVPDFTIRLAEAVEIYNRHSDGAYGAQRPLVERALLRVSDKVGYELYRLKECYQPKPPE